MLKAWRKPDTIIAHDWCWNSLAKHADIVLPCTTTLERNDIAISARDPYVVVMSKVAEPVGSSRNDYDIFTGIARQMGLEQAFTEGRDETDWLEWIYQTTRENAAHKNIQMPDYEDFKRAGWFKPEPPESPVIMLKAFRDDPVANPLSTVTGRIEIYSPTVAAFEYDDCPGHAAWIEPLEWLGGDTRRFPLHLISNQPSTKLHSQLDHGSYSRAAKIKEREPIMLHPADAKKRGLKAGDVVTVFNDRGACLAGVWIDDKIRQGVVQMSTGAWFDPLEPGKPGSLCKHGNPNVLTPDKGSSKLAQGPIAHTCLVEIEIYRGELPAVTAFDPPVILGR
jgi:biotin/methionine sulfoxide reductase